MRNKSAIVVRNQVFKESLDAQPHPHWLDLPRHRRPRSQILGAHLRCRISQPPPTQHSPEFQRQFQFNRIIQWLYQCNLRARQGFWVGENVINERGAGKNDVDGGKEPVGHDNVNIMVKYICSFYHSTPVGQNWVGVI